MDDIRRMVRALSERSVFTVTAASFLAMAVLVVGPLLVGQRPSQRFLVWNLALAWVPYVMALGVEVLSLLRRRWAVLAAGGLWLLFLPNAPYLVTDLTHLHRVSATPWLELARFVAFAWAGCLLAVASLRIVHRVVSTHLGWVTGWAVVVSAAGTSGVGIVVGRFARLNSWQAVTSPTTVLAETLRLIGSRQGLSVAVFFTLLVLVLYGGLGGWRYRPAAAGHS